MLIFLLLEWCAFLPIARCTRHCTPTSCRLWWDIVNTKSPWNANWQMRPLFIKNEDPDCNLGWKMGLREWTPGCCVRIICVQLFLSVFVVEIFLTSCLADHSTLPVTRQEHLLLPILGKNKDSLKSLRKKRGS